MGVSIMLQTGPRRWKDITPGWRSDMAAMLNEIAGYPARLLVFSLYDLDALKGKRAEVARMERFDEQWLDCFDAIIGRIERADSAVVDLRY